MRVTGSAPPAACAACGQRSFHQARGAPTSAPGRTETTAPTWRDSESLRPHCARPQAWSGKRSPPTRHVVRVALAVEQHEAERPVDVGAFGANGIVTHSNLATKPVEQTRRFGLVCEVGRWVWRGRRRTIRWTDAKIGARIGGIERVGIHPQIFRRSIAAVAPAEDGHYKTDVRGEMACHASIAVPEWNHRWCRPGVCRQCVRRQIKPHLHSISAERVAREAGSNADCGCATPLSPDACQP